jgi:hypothetical protein
MPIRGSIAVILTAILGTAQLSPALALSLHQRYSKDQLGAMFTGVDSWRPFPRCDDRAGWTKVSTAVGDHFIAAAEEALTRPVPLLPATLYLQYKRIGNRSNYQEVWFNRRAMLRDLVIAECLEDKGRFLDKITDVVWAICEESSWTWPAHIGRQKAGVDLPDVSDPVVALFSAETGASLAWTRYLLRPRLDRVSPLISRRIEREVQSRILAPYLEREFSWMGFRGGRPNNWNPWINSNVLTAALLMEEDAARRLALIDKVLRSVDRFLVPYPEDGSCDEGPSYWGHAGASLFDCLDLLYSASGGQFDVWKDPIVGEIGRFIYRANIGDDYFVNIGDCHGRFSIYRDLTWRFGRRTGDPAMQAFAAHAATTEDLVDLRYMTRTLHAVFNASNVLADAKTARQPLLADVWLADPDMQLMTARDKGGQKDGLFAAAWGGHNAQSHNHNDVGNVLLFADGKPVLVDAGKPTYTRQTFSSRRYEIWVMQSDYHNCPTINGEQQRPGRRYAARDVTYQRTDTFAELKMDIARAYPPAASVSSWWRTVRLNRGRDLTISDDYELTDATGETALNFLTPCDIRRRSEGEFALADGDEDLILVRYDAAKLRLSRQKIELEDPRLSEVWGPRLNRIRLITKKNARSETLTLVFAKPAK